MENPLITGKFCPNCGNRTKDSDKFCANCGQNTKNTRISFGEFISDSLSSLFSMDSKVLHSIVPLLTKPGFLSIEFLKGKRQQYIMPVRLYLTISILYFFILASGNKFEKISHIFSEKVPVSTAQSILGNEGDPGETTAFVNKSNESDSTSKASTEAEDLNSAISNLVFDINDGEEMDDPLNQYIIDEVKKIAKDPDAFLNYFRDKLSLFFFLTLPIFALILKILYYRKKLTYIEHLVFIFHTQSVLFLLLIIIHFLGFISDEITWIAIVLYLIYALMAIKNFYKQRWLKTIFKYAIISVSFTFISFCSILAAAVLLFLSY